MEAIKVYASPLPFSNKQEKSGAAPGSSVQQIIDSHVPRDLQDFLGIVVMINGDLILRSHWHLIKPKTGTIVNINVLPQGGGGKKNPIASLLSIAVLVAAPYLGAAYGAALGASLGVSTAIGTALVSGTVGIVGSLLTAALAPPPKPSNLGSISNPSESPTQFIEGAKNTLSPYGVVPICLGTNRMFPLQAARPYTETQDNDQYVRQLFTYGFGKVSIGNIKIGETSIDKFTDFDIEHKLNGDLKVGTSIFSNDVFQEDMNVLLQQADGFTERNVQIDSDEAIVDITFPQGLSEFTKEGKRVSRRVQLELQYALVGTEDWSAGAVEYKDFDGTTLAVEPVLVNTNSPAVTLPGNIQAYRSTRVDTIAIDQYNGKSRIYKGAMGWLMPSEQVPSTSIVVGKVTVTTTKIKGSGLTSTSFTVQDIRQPGIFGNLFGSQESFTPSKSGNFAVVENGLLIVNPFDLRGSQTEALRKSGRIVFPERGDYKIRIRRVSNDTSSDQIFDKVYLTAIKSVTYRQPINLDGISGTAVRIKATEQLNGALDQLNAVVSLVIPDYFEDTDAWEEAITSNPASLYRYVLQGPANARPLTDDKIDLQALQAWHSYCAQKGFTYNRVIDYETSVEEILRDIASAGSASPAVVDGKRSIVIDGPKDDIVQIVTPRNSWGYGGEMLYPKLPHAFRVQFRNAEKGYQQDERIVYADGYNESNATLFEVLEVQSCTNPQLAWKIGRRFLAMAKLRPETHTFNMDFENMVLSRGDRVKLEHDVPLIGVGDGRVKSVTISDGLVAAFSVDDNVAIPDSGMYYTRIRLSDGTQLYKQINASVGNYSSFNFTVPFDEVDAPQVGDLAYFTKSGGELDLIVTRIDPQGDLTAKITALDYAPAIFESDTGSIPNFNSNITVPLDFIRPLPPALLNAQSNESVLLVNIDGTFTTRAIFTLRNDNDGDVDVDVKVRRSGDTVFTNANVLEATPERVILTGLDDGFRYDIHIRYRRRGSSMYSLPLQINSYLYVGSSGPPSDVTNFLINITGENALFSWDQNTDVDLQGYRIKFSRVFSGATWDTAQILENMVYDNRLTSAFIPGTYLIKAVDLSGNESINAASIRTYDPGQLLNAIEILEQDPEFLGEKDNVIASNGTLTLADPSIQLGYYYFYETVDLSGVFISTVTASLRAGGTYFNNVFAINDIFATPDIFGQQSGDNDIFTMPDIFAEDDVFGLDPNSWSVELQYRITNDDSNGSPVWTEWMPLMAESLEFRSIQFRLKMESLSPNITPIVFDLSAVIDMPDRIERGEDLTVPIAGTSITYSPAFKSQPSVVITLQNEDAADEIRFVNKNSQGFEFRVYNRVDETFVERVYDFIASGYGRENQ